MGRFLIVPTALLLMIAGCQPGTDGGNAGGNFAVDPDSLVVGTWLLASGSENELPLTADGRSLTVNGTAGTYVVTDDQGTLLQSGEWGVDGNRIRFEPMVAQGNVLWQGFGNFVAEWAVQDGVLSLDGTDGMSNRLILIFEERT